MIGGISTSVPLRPKLASVAVATKVGQSGRPHLERRERAYRTYVHERRSCLQAFRRHLFCHAQCDLHRTARRVTL